MKFLKTMDIITCILCDKDLRNQHINRWGTQGGAACDNCFQLKKHDRTKRTRTQEDTDEDNKRFKQLMDNVRRKYWGDTTVRAFIYSTLLRANINKDVAKTITNAENWKMPNTRIIQPNKQAPIQALDTRGWWKKPPK